LSFGLDLNNVILSFQYGHILMQ